jgi:hypothetical protein
LKDAHVAWCNNNANNNLSPHSQSNLIAEKLKQNKRKAHNHNQIPLKDLAHNQNQIPNSFKGFSPQSQSNSFKYLQLAFLIVNTVI